jgi:ArsR family transcriptional regulator
LETVYVEQAKVFKAFCDERRLKILELLHGGEMCACALMRKMDMPQSSISYHMKVLCEAGIVMPRETGKWTHYRIDEAGCRAACALLQSITTPDAPEPICGGCGHRRGKAGEHGGSL